MSSLNDGLGARILGQCGHRSDTSKTASQNFGSIHSHKKTKKINASALRRLWWLDEAQLRIGPPQINHLKTTA
ncbi:hypothetical protein QTL95_08855 [Rhizobium sp. S152]|uniref:hypothetical protein n=1 Tax=Rhizobium sp. S152 TaxID=3055038 RepID=UPI0025A9695D|nr:hypothetical protein [Rhizobium sp. S152]MDM9626003.1 hypothetical protein [Rhizobium sp. S152]